MDPSDLIPGLGKDLKAYLRPSDEPRDFAFYVGLSLNLMAYGIIAVAFVWGLLHVLERFAGVGLRWQFLIVGAFGAVAIIGIAHYVSTRWLRQRILREVLEEAARLQEHLRMHDESPHWHIVIKTPEEAEEKREEILRLLRPVIIRAAEKELEARRDG